MKLISGFAQRDPSGTLTILTLAAGVVCGAIGHPEYSAVLVAMAAAILGLRTKVVPNASHEATVSDLVGKVETAAISAATQVAKNLDASIVGESGDITAAAQTVATTAAHDVVSGLLGVVK